MSTYKFILFGLMMTFAHASTSTLERTTSTTRQEMTFITPSPEMTNDMTATPVGPTPMPSDDMGVMASPEVEVEPTEDPMPMPTPSMTPAPHVEFDGVPNAYMSCRCIEDGRQCTEYVANRSVVCAANTPRNYQAPVCYWNCCLLCMVNRESEVCQTPGVKRLCAQQFVL